MRISTALYAVLLVFLALESADGSVSVRAIRDLPAYVPGEVLVKFKSDAGPDARESSVRDLGVFAPQDRLPFRKVLLAAGKDVKESVAALRADPGVEWAQPNHRFYALCQPTDPRYADNAWPYVQINAPAGWEILTSGACGVPGPASTSVTVAVLDSGVYSSHPDLDGALAAPADRYNAMLNNTDSEDDNGHGTFVAGLIAAEWGTTGSTAHPAPCAGGTPFTGGMAGLAGGAVILPVKVLDPIGYGTTESIVRGIRHSLDKGAKVINLSLGGALFELAEQEAIDDAIASGCIVVAAVGNEAGGVLYPAAYAPVVAVGATGPSGRVASYSNQGPQVDLVAPGGTAEAGSAADSLVQNVMGPLKCPTPAGYILDPYDPHYGTGAGTSFAVPFVSAALALVWTQNPDWSASQIVRRVLESATDIGIAGWDPASGYGLLNVGNALSGAVQNYSFMKTFNSPNPFYPEQDMATNITLAIDAPAEVELTIRDASGARVLKRVYRSSDLNQNPFNPQFKSYSIAWDGRNEAGNLVVTGVYPYCVKIGNSEGKNKIAVIRGRR